MKKYIYIILIIILASLSFFFFIDKNVRYIPLFAKHGDIIDQLDGVNIYFNAKGKPAKVSTAPCGYRIGIKYQCVEFVKRYYYQHYNHKMPNVWGDAIHFYNPKLKDGELNKERGLLQYKNESSKPPQKGDLLVYKNGKYGHVAIVSEVTDNSITIMHQNASRFRPTRMKHSMKYKNGKWTVDKNALLGWLRIKP